MSSVHLVSRLLGWMIRGPRNVILFVGASPDGTSRLALDLECAAIERELSMTPSRSDFDLHSRWAATIDDLARHLAMLQPTILHLSCHGALAAMTATDPATHRHIAVATSNGASSAGTNGIYLHGEQGGIQFVTARALAMVIRSVAPSVRLLVLNACYSDVGAAQLRMAVDCVIGMTGPIRDDAARSFAVALYRTLGNGGSVGDAVDHAIAVLAAKQFSDERFPRCRTREGTDAYQVVLTALHAKR
jgi:hypothetical protein